MTTTAEPFQIDLHLADVDRTEGLYPYPRFSIGERDRRWRAVRELMAEQGLDVIVTPQNTGHSLDFQANTRWLTQCGGGATADIAAVFPLQGDVTVVATSALARWPTVQNWVSDVREARRNYGRVIVERLNELPTPRSIGIAGLGGGTRTPEGTILHGTYEQIRQAFPAAAMRDATDLLAELRYVKSDEELAFLARSTEMIERGLEAEIAAARPGVSDWEVWAETTCAMMRAGSELPVHCNWVSGRRPLRTLSRPSHRNLEPGDIIFNELEAAWGGYRSQTTVPVSVGDPDPVYPELMKVQRVLFEETLAALKPGTTLGELQEGCARLAREVAPRSGPAAGATGLLTMHGRGQGDDGPIITPSARDPKQLGVTLKERMVFILKPQVHTAANDANITWGDTVIVTRSGGQRLGSRPHGIAIAGQ